MGNTEKGKNNDKESKEEDEEEENGGGGAAANNNAKEEYAKKEDNLSSHAKLIKSLTLRPHRSRKICYPKNPGRLGERRLGKIFPPINYSNPHPNSNRRLSPIP